MDKFSIVADENMPAVDDLFIDLGPIKKIPGRGMKSQDIKDADILLVRSVTQVNESLLAGSRVKFVGTATIGIDHLDTSYLDKNQIRWANAPGCNAISVAEYVMSVLGHFCDSKLDSLQGKQAGVIGYGNVGKRVVERLQLLGLDVRVYDPFIKQNDYAHLASLEQVLDCDVLCVHAPLTRTGDFPTFHMLQLAQLQNLRHGACLISAGRGGVVSNAAIHAMAESRPDVRMAFDVWENEPDIDWSVVSCVEFATPHIAGYSLDGKITGTRMLFDALNDSLGRERHMVSNQDSLMDIDLAAVATENQLSHAIHYVYDVASDDARFRAILTMPVIDRGKAFDVLRKDYPIRREFSSYRLLHLKENLHTLAIALGFKVMDS